MLPACDIAPRDAAAGKGAGEAACSARQSARLKHPLKIGARFPATGIARLAKPRCEIVVVAHRSGSRDAEIVVEQEGSARSPKHINESRSLACRINRSEEHTSELQSLMRISYAVFCLKQKQT